MSGNCSEQIDDDQSNYIIETTKEIININNQMASIKETQSRHIYLTMEREIEKRLSMMMQ
jgi:hypothetical protein